MFPALFAVFGAGHSLLKQRRLSTGQRVASEGSAAAAEAIVKVQRPPSPVAPSRSDAAVDAMSPQKQAHADVAPDAAAAAASAAAAAAAADASCASSDSEPLHRQSPTAATAAIFLLVLRVVCG